MKAFKLCQIDYKEGDKLVCINKTPFYEIGQCVEIVSFNRIGGDYFDSIVLPICSGFRSYRTFTLIPDDDRYLLKYFVTFAEYRKIKIDELLNDHDG